ALSHLMMFAPFPSVKNGKGSIKDAMGGCNGFVIGKNAPDEAIEFLEFFTRAENLQKSFDVFPAIPTVNEVVIKNEGHKAVKKYLNTMSSFNLYPDQLFPLETGSMINEVSARIMLGELTPEEGCKILDRTWEASKD
ncbi:MAG TPA: ABC transporter substrate-binding protein, partial [Spirochaetota bacterium]|nr:ABC transporter substrate-binding protein [Spirochaetota bacterium]